VVADHDGSAVRLSTHQVLSQARKVADAAGLRVSLLLLAENADSLAAGSAGFGADRVIAVEQAAFKHPTLEACAGCLKALLPGGSAVLFTVANDLGRDLAATMACAWNGGLLQDVIGEYVSAHVKTTLIDALAERGVLFKESFVQAPFTWSSFGSMLTVYHA